MDTGRDSTDFLRDSRDSLGRLSRDSFRSDNRDSYIRDSRDSLNLESSSRRSDNRSSYIRDSRDSLNLDTNSLRLSREIIDNDKRSSSEIVLQKLERTTIKEDLDEELGGEEEFEFWEGKDEDGFDLGPPTILVTPESFKVDLREINQIVRLGYLKKRKNQNSATLVERCQVRVLCQTANIRMRKLRLVMAYRVRKSPSVNLYKEYVWSRDFPIQLAKQDPKMGICTVILDAEEIYESIFKFLAKNTHLSDDDRKIPINVYVLYVEQGRVGGPNSRASMRSMRLREHTHRFFVCGWRKGIKLEKSQKREEYLAKSELRMFELTRLVGILPQQGTAIQPISVYLDVPNLKEFMTVFGGGNRISVFFGVKKAQICSMMVERHHAMFKSCLRIVAVVPNCGGYVGNVKVTVGVIGDTSNSSGFVGQQSVRSFRGDSRFMYIRQLKQNNNTNNSNNNNRQPWNRGQVNPNTVKRKMDIDSVSIPSPQLRNSFNMTPISRQMSRPPQKMMQGRRPQVRRPPQQFVRPRQGFFPGQNLGGNPRMKKDNRKRRGGGSYEVKINNLPKFGNVLL